MIVSGCFPQGELTDVDVGVMFLMYCSWAKLEQLTY